MKIMCTQAKPFINKKHCSFSSFFSNIITCLSVAVKGRKKENAAASAAAFMRLSLAEGLAVSALILSGVCFVGAHQNAVQRAVVLAVAVVSAGLNGAFDALVSITVHSSFLLLFDSGLVWLTACERNMEKFSFALLFFTLRDMMSVIV